MAVQRPAANVDMYIVLVFIGVVSLRYDNTAEWFLMAKLKPAFRVPVNGRVSHSKFVKLLYDFTDFSI